MSTEELPIHDVHAARRANMYYVLARVLRPPRDWEPELAALVEEACLEMEPPLPELGRALSAEMEAGSNDGEALQVAHAKLFLGPFEIKAAPWAAFYLEKEPQLMGPSSQYAARAYAEAGLAPGEKLRDTPDHVTHELEFMYYLAFGEATSGDPRWTERQTRFWREHLGRWLPRFADAVRDADVHPAYTRMADLLNAFAEQERLHFGFP